MVKLSVCGKIQAISAPTGIPLVMSAAVETPGATKGLTETGDIMEPKNLMMINPFKGRTHEHRSGYLY